MDISICLKVTILPEWEAISEKLKQSIEKSKSRRRKTYTLCGRRKHKRKTSILSNKVVKRVAAMPDLYALSQKIINDYRMRQPPYRELTVRSWSCNTTDGSLAIKDIPLSTALADLQRAKLEGRLL